jgi:tetratricopeptide (TPR) repeat protein
MTLMNDRKKTIALCLVILIGTTCAALLVRRIEGLRPPDDPSVADESLYVAGKTARRMSLCFNGLAADWYWMRSLQYVGRKIMKDSDIPIDDLASLDLKLLAPLLDTATTLDPEFLDPYEYAAIVLPEIDVQEAIRITQKGIDANPNAWRLHQHLGYIYWQQHNYAAAGEVYSRGAQIPGAPSWMEAMKAKMAAEGGSRATAREIYSQMYEQSGEENIRDVARRRLLQLDSLDQRDNLRKLFAAYQARAGHCPNSWKELEHVFRTLHVPVTTSGAPLDPSGVPYVLRSGACEVDLDPKSEIPVK